MKSIVPVTGASDSYRLTTVSAVKTAMGIDDAAADAFLAATIDRQSAAVCNWCRRVFAKQSYSETFRDVWCMEAISLKHFPLTAIASITVDGTALDTDEYERDDATGLLYRLSDDVRIEWAGVKIVAVYTAGYVLPAQTLAGAGAAGTRSLPHDIEEAAILLAKMQYYARDRDPLLRSVTSPGVQSEDFAIPGAAGGMSGGMPGNVAALLAPYRKVMIG